MDDSDEVLLRRVAQRDERAFEQLYARHAGHLMRYAQQLTGSRGAAEEVLQDTFVGVWRGALGFLGDSAVRTWLFGICRRQALKRLRDLPRPGLPLDLASELPSPSDPLPEEIVLARADVAAVGTAIATLPHTHREVLHLAFAAELPHAAIADLLGIPVGTVKSRLFTARATLARAIVVEEAGR